MWWVGGSSFPILWTRVPSFCDPPSPSPSLAGCSLLCGSRLPNLDGSLFLAFCRACVAFFWGLLRLPLRASFLPLRVAPFLCRSRRGLQLPCQADCSLCCVYLLQLPDCLRPFSTQRPKCCHYGCRGWTVTSISLSALEWPSFCQVVLTFRPIRFEAQPAGWECRPYP